MGLKGEVAEGAQAGELEGRGSRKGPGRVRLKGGVIGRGHSSRK